MKTNKCLHIANIIGGYWYCNYEMPNRVYSQEGICPTILTYYGNNQTGFKIEVKETKIDSMDMKEKGKYRIRKLTPKECFRLMGFDDDDYLKASKVNSEAQLYKQTGNSIVVNVLEAIFKQFLEE